MSVFLFSDPHFGHRRIIELADRPFSSLQDMEESIISNYQRVVKRTDTVLWLGDSFFYPIDQAREILGRLPGEKFTLVGNHDRSASWLARVGFTVLTGEVLLHIADRICRLSHYPESEDFPEDKFAAKRPKRQKGEFLIHGHTHSKTRWNGHSIHVGVDAWDFSPVPMVDIALYIKLATASTEELNRAEEFFRKAGLIKENENGSQEEETRTRPRVPDSDTR